MFYIKYKKLLITHIMETGVNEWPDFLVIGIYFIIIGAVGVWVRILLPIT